jgi:hypothetical protein
MNARAAFDAMLGALAGLGALTFLALLFVDAPYGRHLRRGFGPLVNATAGWVLMESAAAVVPAATFLAAGAPLGPVPWICLGLWELHYLYRAFVYPFRRGHAGTMRRSAGGRPAARPARRSRRVKVTVGVTFALDSA